MRPVRTPAHPANCRAIKPRKGAVVVIVVVGLILSADCVQDSGFGKIVCQ